MIRSGELANEATSTYTEGKGFLYDHVSRYISHPIDKTRLLINIKVNSQRRSMKGILLLFVEPYNAGAKDSEKSIFPDLKKVSVTINGSPNMLYNNVTTLYLFADRDPRLYLIICEHHQVEIWLKLVGFSFEGTNTLIVLDDCAASKDVKGRTAKLVKLGFSARHAGISLWVLTQQLSRNAKPFRENVAAIVLFYTPSSKPIKTIFLKKTSANFHMTK